MTNVIEYARRFTLNMTNLNKAHKRKGRSRLYRIVENDFATTVTTKRSVRSSVVNILKCVNAVIIGCDTYTYTVNAWERSKKLSIMHSNLIYSTGH